MKPSRTPIALALALCLSPAVQAQQQTNQPGQHRHDPVDLDGVVVKASPLATTAEDLTRPVEVLTGARLDEARATTLGDTVDGLPGVQSSHFGPGVGRPIIRGMDGARVQVVSDGLAAGDVSTVSVDHAVAIEPFLADQIEVLKGPATLLYGSGAIGGAVNVLDGRIPERLSQSPSGLSGRAELRAGDPTRSRIGMLRIDGSSGTTSGFAFHVDAMHREVGDLRIPGFAESAALLAAEGEVPDPDSRGRLPNSAVATTAFALGGSLIGERGFVGASASRFETRYGVPGHAHADGGHDDHDDHDHDHDHDDHGHDGHAGVRSDLWQQRHELRAGLDDLRGWGGLRLKYAQTDYTHREIEDDVVGTVFDNQTREARLEWVHTPVAGWQGALGLHWADRDFRAIGEEAFVPPTQGNDLGLFWMGRRDYGAVDVEIGARHDRVRIHSTPQPLLERDHRRRFGITSLSAAASWEPGESLHLALGLDRAQRAPTSEELYSNGYHVATGSFELGDSRLRPETANRIELGAHWHSPRLSLAASLYRADFRDYLYQSALADADHGNEQLTLDGAQVYLWTQGDARFVGAEAEATFALTADPENAWDLRVFADAVRGKLLGSGSRSLDVVLLHGDHVHAHQATLALGGNLPRMAPGRIGAELRHDGRHLRGSLAAVRTLAQERVAAQETATPGYTLVNAHLSWHHDIDDGTAWEVFLDARNLLDAEARPHTSFLKDLAPLQGRDLQLGVRWYF